MATAQIASFLTPYIPPPYLAIFSTALSSLERLILPTLRSAHYALTTLDPAALIPLALSILTLYLSILSIYHTVRTGVRLGWFLLKWGAIASLIFFALGGDLNSAFGSAGINLQGPQPIGRRGGDWWAQWGGRRQGFAAGSGTRARDGDADPFSLLGDSFASFLARPAEQQPIMPPSGSGSGKSKRAKKRNGAGQGDDFTADMDALARVGGIFGRWGRSIFGEGDAGDVNRRGRGAGTRDR